MLNVKYLAHVFWEIARVYCAFKVCENLQDYYHCYSSLVDNYLKKQNKKTFFSFHYNRIEKSRLKKSQTNTFSTLVHLPLSLSLQFNPIPQNSPPYYSLPPIPIPFPSLLSPSHFIFSYPLPTLLRFLFKLKFSILFPFSLLFVTSFPYAVTLTPSKCASLH